MLLSAVYLLNSVRNQLRLIYFSDTEVNFSRYSLEATVPPPESNDSNKGPDDIENLCPICLDEIRQEIRIHECGHKFCRNCLLTYLLHRYFDKKMGRAPAGFVPAICPYCRRRFRFNEPSLLERAQEYLSILQAQILNQ